MGTVPNQQDSRNWFDSPDFDFDDDDDDDDDDDGDDYNYDDDYDEDDDEEDGNCSHPASLQKLVWLPFDAML